MMKYIKPYNESNKLNIIPDIKDILMELNDSEYDTEVFYCPGNRYEVLVDNHGLIINEDDLIIETLTRVIDYMKNLGFSYDIDLESIDKISRRHSYRHINSIDYLFKSGTTTGIQLNFEITK